MKMNTTEQQNKTDGRKTTNDALITLLRAGMFVAVMLVLTLCAGTTAAGAADEYVNESGWWDSGGMFHVSGAPIHAAPDHVPMAIRSMGTTAPYHEGSGVADINRGFDKNQPEFYNKVIAEKNFVRGEPITDARYGHGMYYTDMTTSTGEASSGRYERVAGASVMNLPAEFNDIYADYGGDTDRDDLYDYIAVEIGVNVAISGQNDEIATRADCNNTIDEINEVNNNCTNVWPPLPSLCQNITVVENDTVHQGTLTIPENLTLIIRGCNYIVMDGDIFIHGSLVLEDAKIMQDYSGEINYWRDMYVYGNLTSTNSTIEFSAVTAKSNSIVTLINSTLDYLLRAGGSLDSAIYESNSTILIERSIIPRLAAQGANEYVIGDECVIDMFEEIIGVDEGGRLYYWNNTIGCNSSEITIPNVNISEDVQIESKYYCIVSKGFVDVRDSTLGYANALYSGTIVAENVTTYPYSLSAWYGGTVYARNSNLDEVYARENSQVTAINTTIEVCVASGTSNVSVVGGSIDNIHLCDDHSAILFVDIGMTDIASGNVPVHIYMQNVSKVEKVEFYVNNTLKFSDDSPEFLWMWNTTEISNGRSELLAKTYFVDEKMSEIYVEIHVYNEGSPVVTITTDASTYSPGDTMIVALDIANPTSDPVAFEWYVGVPHQSIWVTYARASIPAGFDNSYTIPIPVGNWGPTPFDFVHYVRMLDPVSGDVLVYDVAWVCI